MKFSTFLIISITTIAIITPFGYWIVLDIFDSYDMNFKSDDVFAQAWENNKQRSIEFVLFGIPSITFIIAFAYWFCLLREINPNQNEVRK